MLIFTTLIISLALSWTARISLLEQVAQDVKVTAQGFSICTSALEKAKEKSER